VKAADCTFHAMVLLSPKAIFVPFYQWENSYQNIRDVYNPIQSLYVKKSHVRRARQNLHVDLVHKDYAPFKSNSAAATDAVRKQSHSGPIAAARPQDTGSSTDETM
jgi:hypothetical protein